jgi:hypothetical protein
MQNEGSSRITGGTAVPAVRETPTMKNRKWSDSSF